MTDDSAAVRSSFRRWWSVFRMAGWPRWGEAALLVVVFGIGAAVLAAGPVFVAGVGDDLAGDAVSQGELAVASVEFKALLGDGFVELQDELGDALTQADGVEAAIPTVAVGSDRSVGWFGDSNVGDVVLAARPGLLEAVVPVAGPVGDSGVWVSERVVDKLGVAPGDVIEMRDPAFVLHVPVVGVYADLPPIGPNPYWDSVPRELVPKRIVAMGGIVVPELLIADEGLAASLPALVEVGSVVPATVWWQVWLDSDAVGLERLDDLAAGLAGLEVAAADPASELGRLFREAGVERVAVESEIGSVAAGVQVALVEVGPAIRSVEVTALAVALMVVAAGGVVMARRRERVLRMAMVEGRHPAWLGCAAGATSIPAAALGAAAGVLVGVAGASLLFPNTVGAGISGVPFGRIVGFVVAGLFLVGVSVAMVARATVVAQAPRRWLWDGLLVGVAVLWWFVVVRREPGPGTDLLGIGFSLVVSAAMVTVIVRLVVAVARLGDRVGSGWAPVPLLAWRRLTGTASGRLGVAVPIGVAVAVAVFTYAMSSAVRDGMEQKATVAVGAETSARASTTALESDLLPGSGLLWSGSGSLASGRVQLVVADPATYSQIVDWPGADSVASILDRVTYTGGETVPVIVSGPGAPPVGSEGTVRIQSMVLHYEVVGEVAAIPLMRRVMPTMFASSDAVVDWAFAHPATSGVNRIITPSGEPPDRYDLLRGLQPRLVFADSPDRVALRLQDLGVRTASVETRQSVLTTPAFVAQWWAYRYLRVLALVGVALSLMVMGFAVLAQSRRGVVTRAIASRMGFGRRVSGLVGIIDLAAILVVGLGAGAFVGWFLAVTAGTRFDPLPDTAPGLTISMPWVELAWLIALAVVAGTATWWIADRAARRADVAEVMRGE